MQGVFQNCDKVSESDFVQQEFQKHQQILVNVQRKISQVEACNSFIEQCKKTGDNFIDVVKIQQTTGVNKRRIYQLVSIFKGIGLIYSLPKHYQRVMTLSNGKITVCRLTQKSLSKGKYGWTGEINCQNFQQMHQLSESFVTACVYQTMRQSKSRTMKQIIARVNLVISQLLTKTIAASTVLKRIHNVLNVFECIGLVQKRGKCYQTKFDLPNYAFNINEIQNMKNN